MDSDTVVENDYPIQLGPREKIDHKPPWRRAKVDEKDIKALLKSRYRYLKTINTESAVNSSNIPCRKSMPARLHSLSSADGEKVNSEHVHHNSKVVGKGVGPILNDEAFLSFEIVDHMPSSSSKSKRPPLIPSEPSSSSKSKCNTRSCNLPKSYSTNACGHSEEGKTKASPKSRFSPFRKMFDPIMKSKSMRNPSCMETDVDMQHGLPHKSLLSNFSRTVEVYTKESNNTIRNPSPIYQNAILKLDCKHVVPLYKFVTKDSKEEFLVAKPWRTNTEFNSVYTFHSSKQKSWYNQSTSMIGQMQVSSYLCSEVHDNGVMEATIVSEFNLYDVAQGRKSITEDFKYNPSTSYPLAHGDLHSCLEIAAVVVKIPFHKKGIQEADTDKVKGVKGLNFECISRASVEVVTTSGTHGLSCSEDAKPSSLLERWRCGGRCDCGGWDMSCPILVLDKKCDVDVADCLKMENPSQVVLFVQGRKRTFLHFPYQPMITDNTQLISMSQLSALQAFSICISTLHSSQAASTLTKVHKQKLNSDSLKLLVKEGLKHKTDVVEEEEGKTKESVKKIPLSHIFDPPFSPIGRV